MAIDQIILRIVAAMVAGAVVGIERESHGRAAGLRTTILVSVAACIAMLISESLFGYVVGLSPSSYPDPRGLASGVCGGRGVIAAGACIRHGDRVRAVSTGASLWYVTTLGLGFGS